MTAQMPPPSKKTEMIEVRVSHETKRNFLAACRLEGRTASDVIREALDSYISRGPLNVAGDPPEKPLLRLVTQALRRKRYLAIGAVAAGMTVLAALPSAALPSVVQGRAPPACDRFLQLDQDGDGAISFDEFRSRG